MSSAAECTFHVASLTVRGPWRRLGFVLELLESDGELLESDGERFDEKECFAIVWFWCFEEFCGAIELAWSDQLDAIDVI